MLPTTSIAANIPSRKAERPNNNTGPHVPKNPGRVSVCGGEVRSRARWRRKVSRRSWWATPRSPRRWPGTEYMVCYPHVPMRDAFYKAVPNFKLVQLTSAGYDNLDLEAARRARVPVSNNGGAKAISISEDALMLMLTVDASSPGSTVAAGGAGAATDLRRACMSCSTRPSASSASDHRQEGRAARACLRHAGAVIRHRPPVRGRGGPARRQVPLAGRTARVVRIVSLHAAQRSTRHMIGAEELAAMKPKRS